MLNLFFRLREAANWNLYFLLLDSFVTLPPSRPLDLSSSSNSPAPQNSVFLLHCISLLFSISPFLLFLVSTFSVLSRQSLSLQPELMITRF